MDIINILFLFFVCKGLIVTHHCGEPGVLLTKGLLQHQKHLLRVCFWEPIHGLYITTQHSALIHKHTQGMNNLSQFLIYFRSKQKSTCFELKKLLFSIGKLNHGHHPLPPLPQPIKSNYPHFRPFISMVG